MKRAAILIGLVLAPFALGGLTFSRQAPPDAPDRPLLAVTKRADFAFALVADGLYRAKLDAKRWERLSTPPTMPLDGAFARLPDRSPLVLYVTREPWHRAEDRPGPPGRRDGLYLSRDDGATWTLASGRGDLGSALLLPNGTLYALTVDWSGNGHAILQSPDLGATWKDITGKAFGNLRRLEPDPDHPGLVRVEAWALRDYVNVATDEAYNWKSYRFGVPATGRRPSEEFFTRDASSTNRLYSYPATLSNYFGHDFGDQARVTALEVVPLKPRHEFARSAPIRVPIRVVFHWDQAATRNLDPKASPPSEKFAVQPDGLDFWGVRVETAETRTVRHPVDRDVVTLSIEATADGKPTTRESQPPAVKYQIINLSPSTPYEQAIDLGKLADFSKPGEYRVQLIYNSGGSPDRDKGEWDGSFTSPVFTVVIGR